MNRGFYTAAIIAGLVASFLAINVLAVAWLNGARLDATQNQLYTLSKGTDAIIADLREPITLSFYYTPEAASASPLARAYGGRVRALLQAYAARSNGKVRLNEINPAPFTDAEDKAIAAGLQGVPLSEGADPLYLGMVATDAVDQTQTIPFFAPERESALEYEVSAAIAQLANPKKPRIAVITSLPWLFGPSGNGEGGVAIGKEITQSFDIEVLGEDFDRIPSSADVLLIAQPRALSVWQQYVIDQFALTKRRTLVLADPAAVTATSLGGATAIADHLGALPQSWGIALSRQAIVDRAAGLPVSVSEGGRSVMAVQPLYFHVPPDALSKRDLVTETFARGINVGAPGAITAGSASSLKLEPLALASMDAARIDPDRALSQPTPRSLLDGYAPDPGEAVLAVRLTGALKTAFPEGPPPRPVPGEATTPAPIPSQPPFQRASTGNVDIIVVADVDFLNDGFYLAADGQPPAADNAAFMLNALDSLSGSDALVSLRSRAPMARPLVVVEQIRTAAMERSAAAQKTLEAELADTQQRLKTLEAKGAGSGFLNGDASATRSPAETEELERFRLKLVDIRGKLRSVERSYRTEVDTIKAWLMGVTIGVVPALILFVSVVGFVVRRRAVGGKA